MGYHCKSWDISAMGNSPPYPTIFFWIGNVNRNRCRTLILMSSQLPELQNIPFNALSILLTPPEAFLQWSPLVKLGVIVLIVFHALTKSKRL